MWIDLLVYSIWPPTKEHLHERGLNHQVEKKARSTYMGHSLSSATLVVYQWAQEQRDSGGRNGDYAWVQQSESPLTRTSLATVTTESSISQQQTRYHFLLWHHSVEGPAHPLDCSMLTQITKQAAACSHRKNHLPEWGFAFPASRVSAKISSMNLPNTSYHYYGLPYNIVSIQADSVQQIKGLAVLSCSCKFLVLPCSPSP